MTASTANPQPTVSVIIPCHNYAHYLPSAIESVLAQDSPALEIIVVDDGSTDGSAALAGSYGSPVKVLSQARQGIGGARNSGIAVASGELLGFLDADDIWPPESVTVRLEAFRKNLEIECVFGRVEQFLCPNLNDEARAKLHCPAGLMNARFAGTMLIRKDSFARVGPFNTDLRVGEMMEWIVRLQDSGVRTAAVDGLVLQRRIHASNTVLSSGASKRDYLRALQTSVRRRAGRL